MGADTPPPQAEIVVVGAARLSPSPVEGAFSIVRVDESRFEAVARLDSVLDEAPGASLFRRNSSLVANPTTQGVSLRALAPSGAGRALVTLDGVPQNDPFGGWVIWSALPPESIGGASIVRGAGAGPYGAGALTGVIALEERSSDEDFLLARLSAGELETGRAAGAGEFGLGGSRLFFTASGETSDGFIPVRAGRGAADIPLTLESKAGAFRLHTDIGGAALAARLSAYQEERGSGLVDADSSSTGYSASLTLAAAPAPGTLGWRVQGWVRKSDLENSSVAVAAGRTGTTPANDQYETPATGWGLNAALRRASADYSWEIGGDLRAADGESREFFRYMAGAYTRDRRAGGDALTAGLYAEGSRTLGPWLLVGGARVDRWSTSNGLRRETDLANGVVTLQNNAPDRDGIVPTARLGLRYDLGGDYFWRAAAYAGFRPPTLNELHRPFRVGNDITEANPGLEPERLYGGEIAFGRASEDLSFSAGLFYNRLEDAVANVTIGAGPGSIPIPGFLPPTFVPAGGVLRQRQNAGAIEAWGAEAEASLKLSQSLSLRGAAAYTEAEVDGGTSAPQLTGKRPAQAPRFTAMAGAVWSPLSALTLEGDIRFESARFDDDLNLRRLDAATTLDARAVWDFSTWASLELAAENLLDSEVETALTGDGIVSYGAPRLVRVGLILRR